MAYLSNKRRGVIFFRVIITPDVLVAYCHSHNKSTEKGEAVFDVGALSLRMLKILMEGGVGGPNMLRVLVYREGMVVEKRRQGPRVPHTQEIYASSYRRTSGEKGEAVMGRPQSKSSGASSQGNSER